MRPKTRIIKAALISLLITALGAALWRTSHSDVSDPIFQGKALSAWLRSYYDYDGMWPLEPPKTRTDEVNQAVREIGTNGIPLLVDMLKVKDSRLKASIISIMSRQNWAKIHITSAEELHSVAYLGFKALGPAAKPAIPALTELINDRKTTLTAIGSLSAIGADAIPILAGALTNRDATIRVEALSGLCHIKGSERDIVLLLLDRLKDADPLVRGYAADSFRALEVFDEQPKAVVSGLIELLDDSADWPRKAAAEALGQFRENAKPAIPKLLRAIKDKNQEVRKNAATSIWLIDPDVAGKAGIDVFRGKYGE